MAGTDPKGNGWNEWKRLVLSDLEDLKTGYGSLKGLLQEMQKRQHAMELNILEHITEVKIRSRTQGAIFGTIAGAFMSVFVGLILKYM